MYPKINLFSPRNEKYTFEVAESRIDPGVECTLQLLVDYGTYEMIKEKELFNLTPQAYSEEMENQLENNGKPVEVTIKLGEDLLDLLSLFGQNGEEIKNNLIKEHEEYNTLLDTDNWYALSFTQEVELPEELKEEGSELRMGYTTKWAEVDQIAESIPMTLIIERFLEDNGWPAKKLEDGSVFTGVFQGDDGRWIYYIEAREEAGQCAFYSVFPAVASKEDYPNVIEFLMRINSGLPVGNFELDFEDGEIKFKTYVDVGYGELDDTLLRQVIEGNITVMNTYYLGIKEILEEKTPAEILIRKIED
ncbi:MAG: YbjN domain-containing protein [Clostridia bacterium]|nr:YbjN domain-containing protein [Clostridia bacterium]